MKMTDVQKMSAIRKCLSRLSFLSNYRDVEEMADYYHSLYFNKECVKLSDIEITKLIKEIDDLHNEVEEAVLKQILVVFDNLEQSQDEHDKKILQDMTTMSYCKLTRENITPSAYLFSIWDMLASILEGAEGEVDLFDKGGEHIKSLTKIIEDSKAKPNDVQKVVSLFPGAKK